MGDSIVGGSLEQEQAFFDVRALRQADLEELFLAEPWRLRIIIEDARRNGNQEFALFLSGFMAARYIEKIQSSGDLATDASLKARLAKHNYPVEGYRLELPLVLPGVQLEAERSGPVSQ